MARKKAWQQLLKLHAMHRVGMLRGGVSDAVLDELAGERAGIGKRPAVQQRAEHDRRKQVSGAGIILRDSLVPPSADRQPEPTFPGS